jgi:hypothetical protein
MMTIRPFSRRALLSGTVSLLLAAVPLGAQQPTMVSWFHTDSDHDGLSDALEQQLPAQCAPKFMVGEHDCSVTPAEFEPDIRTPEVRADNGTISCSGAVSIGPFEVSRWRLRRTR